MKKILGRNVLYICQSFAQVDTTHSKFFPFLNANLVSSVARQQITVKGIHAMANWSNIKTIVPHKHDFQQFVFFGRSNVGKSTLINKLIRKDFVETSKKPGKTKQLAFLKVNFPMDTLLVDAPGYGYASDASKQEILQWGKLVDYYLRNTPKSDRQLIMVLVDVMHGLKETDGMLIKMLKNYSKKFMIVYTKSDRAKQKEVEKSVQVAKQIQQNFSNMLYHVHYTSAKTGEGIDELRNHILHRMASNILYSSKGE